MNKANISKEMLYSAYVEEELSTRQCAEKFNISQTQVRRLIEIYDIPVRSPKESKNTEKYQERAQELAQRYKEEYTKTHTLTCKYCGKQFQTKGSDQKRKKFCSEECLRNFQKRLAYKDEENPAVDQHEKQYCKNCGKEIIIDPSKRWIKRKYCDECSKKYSWMRPVRIKTNCSYCGKELEVIKSRLDNHEEIYCDIKCMGKRYKERFSGENSPAWKGGKGHHYLGHWYNARNNARKRDNYTCQLCGITEEEYGQEMSVHHKINYREFEDKEEANNLNNLISLCEPCHRFIHSNLNVDKYLIEEKEENNKEDIV